MTQLSLFDPIQIPLTRGYSVIVDPIDADLAAHKWCAIVAKTGVYAMRRIGRPSKFVQMHRVILARVLGRELRSDEYVDHRDGDPTNNRRDNLRLSTLAENCRNQKRSVKNTSGYKGVSFSKQTQKWRAQITVDQVNHNLGDYDTPEAAYEAYCAAARELHGEFARVE